MGRGLAVLLGRMTVGATIVTVIAGAAAGGVGRDTSAGVGAAMSKPAAGAAAGAAAGPRGGRQGTLRMETVTLHIFHRVFANFHDRVDARLGREFRIGDSDYTGRVIQFVPDFTMDLKTRRVTTRSQEPNNPAFHVVVRKNGVPQDTTWAFLNMPPHFARKSLVAFLATRVTFENHAPVMSRDSLARSLMKTEKP